MPGTEDAEPRSLVPVTEETMRQLLGFSVHDIDMYIAAFTHKSACRSPECTSYERLEFIGDRVVGFIVALYLYNKFPNENEGFLTRLKTKLVCSKFFSYLASQLGLHDYIIMNPRGLRTGQHKSPKIMEDVFEALCGAIFFSEGMHVLKPFVIHLIEKYVTDSYLMVEDNYKDAIMRYTHANHLPLPVYNVLNDPQNTKHGQFDVCVTIHGAWGRGRATTRKNAEQMAAMNLLKTLGLLGDDGHALVVNKNQAMAGIR